MLGIIDNDLVLNQELPNSAKILYLTLNALSDELNFICISEKNLAESLICTEKTIRNNINILEEFGLVVRYREHIRAVYNYVLIPYGMRRGKVIIHNSEELEKLLISIEEYLRGCVEFSLNTDIISNSILDRALDDSEFKAYDYAEYFIEKLFLKNGLRAVRDTRGLASIKRVTKGKSKAENIRLIDIYIDIYDIKFKSSKYPAPTLINFGTTWVYNIVVDSARRINRNFGESEDILAEEVF